MLVCSLVHHGQVDLTRSKVRISQNAFERYPRDIRSAAVQRCDFCANATYWNDAGTQACVALCPVGAIRYSETPPESDGRGGWRINFRGKGWKKIGYETD